MGPSRAISFKLLVENSKLSCACRRCRELVVPTLLRETSDGNRGRDEKTFFRECCLGGNGGCIGGCSMDSLCVEGNGDEDGTGAVARRCTKGGFETRRCFGVETPWRRLLLLRETSDSVPESYCGGGTG